jgi:hypothetical protein
MSVEQKRAGGDAFSSREEQLSLDTTFFLVIQREKKILECQVS